jgi:hypothetical protein
VKYCTVEGKIRGSADNGENWKHLVVEGKGKYTREKKAEVLNNSFHHWLNK